ncbi:MAG: MerR family transcriptional regulator [Alistipes sp.]|nr:MerR family transcriptional regulator [Alistipes sp.]
MAKLLYSMGEVTEMLDVNPSLIRYWESKFDCIRPHKNKKGNRMFTPSDVENLKLIYHLVKEKGMTLEGANRTMKRRGGKVKHEVSILERLQNIRAMLVEVRDSLGDNSPIEYEAPIEAVSELITDVEAEAKAAVVESVMVVEKSDEPQPDVKESEDVCANEEKAEEQPAPRRRGRPRKNEAKPVEQESTEEAQTAVARRRTKRQKADEMKELFPFYEQSLF